jgi:hypothetical protein
MIRANSVARLGGFQHRVRNLPDVSTHRVDRWPNLIRPLCGKAMIAAI